MSISNEKGLPDSWKEKVCIILCIAVHEAEAGDHIYHTQSFTF